MIYNIINWSRYQFSHLFEHPIFEYPKRIRIGKLKDCCHSCPYHVFLDIYIMSKDDKNEIFTKICYQIHIVDDLRPKVSI